MLRRRVPLVAVVAGVAFLGVAFVVVVVFGVGLDLISSLVRQVLNR